MTTRLLIIGGVAGGATAAARARRIERGGRDHRPGARAVRLLRQLRTALLHLAATSRSASELLLQTPEGFDARYRGQGPACRPRRWRSTGPGSGSASAGPEGERWLPYDKLILAQGGNPIMPPHPGRRRPPRLQALDRARTWTGSTASSSGQKPRDRGGGGRRLHRAGDGRGLPQARARDHRGRAAAHGDGGHGPRVRRAGGAASSPRNGVQVITGVGVKAVDAAGKTVELADGRRLPADLVLFSVGVRPELTLAKAAGLELGPVRRAAGRRASAHLRSRHLRGRRHGRGARTRSRAGRCASRWPGPANRQGRIAASNALGPAHALRRRRAAPAW